MEVIHGEVIDETAQHDVSLCSSGCPNVTSPGLLFTKASTVDYNKIQQKEVALQDSFPQEEPSSLFIAVYKMLYKDGVEKLHIIYGYLKKIV
jgi:hypothetical protein